MFYKDTFREQDRLEMKTMIAKNKNLTEGLGDKVKEFSEKTEPKVKETGEKVLKDQHLKDSSRKSKQMK